jgi:hypothetical protein
MKKYIDAGKYEMVKVDKVMKHETITRGLRSALATGNWGKDKQGNVQKTGVA